MLTADDVRLVALYQAVHGIGNAQPSSAQMPEIANRLRAADWPREELSEGQRRELEALFAPPAGAASA